MGSWKWLSRRQMQAVACPAMPDQSPARAKDKSPRQAGAVLGHPNGMKIIQPGVAAMKSRLRRVTDQKIINPERVASIHTYCSPKSITYRFNFATNPEMKSCNDPRSLRPPERPGRPDDFVEFGLGVAAAEGEGAGQKPPAVPRQAVKIPGDEFFPRGLPG